MSVKAHLDTGRTDVTVVGTPVAVSVGVPVPPDGAADAAAAAPRPPGIRDLVDALAAMGFEAAPWRAQGADGESALMASHRWVEWRWSGAGAHGVGGPWGRGGWVSH